jgi:UDP-N-acetyl-D-mannosaminuronate dehydrogenase
MKIGVVFPQTEIGSDPGRIGVLGLSFKPNTDDLRGSPAIAVVRRLLSAGHSVVVHDPAVTPDRVIGTLRGVRFAERPEDVFVGADAVAVATDWPEYLELDFGSLRGVMRRPLLYDGRNMFDPRVVSEAGLAYRGIGRRDVEAASAQGTDQDAGEALGAAMASSAPVGKARAAS